MKDLTEGQKKYALKLKDPLWIKRRSQIIIRDKRQCCNCKSKKSLQVHHLYYTGNDPWLYPSDALITLCKKCHTKEHEGKTSNDFTRSKAKSIFSFRFYKPTQSPTKKQKTIKERRSEIVQVWSTKRIKRKKIKQVSASERQRLIAMKNILNRIGK